MTIVTTGAQPSSEPALYSSFRAKFTEIVLSSDEIAKIVKLSKELGLKLTNLSGIPEDALIDFYEANKAKEAFNQNLWEVVQETGADPVARYDVEYGTSRYSPFVQRLNLTFPDKPDLRRSIVEAFKEEPNYKFQTPIIDPLRRDYFKDALSLLKSKSPKVLDVGSGNCQLLESLIESESLEIDQVAGIDISPAAISLLSQRVISGYTGTLPDLFKFKGSQDPERVVLPNSINLLLLSYFIDRDSNQKGTFDAAKQALANGGTLILEGLFPVKPEDSHGIRYALPENTITTGTSAAEDIEAVAKYLSTGQNKLSLKEIIVGERLVYSLDGFEILPSIFLIFNKD